MHETIQFIFACSFNDPYTDTDFRYVMTNSMQVGPSYVFEFELRMGCGSPFMQNIDNVVS